ncbi:MAG TPA: glycosyltransferase family 2 protein [Polyangia bacterium]|nr:glycosyltransferase family 2 protein [Polyangia bacterium]
MAAPLRVSVVIANWNYAEYLGAAIDSALGLDWPDVEVVVVDDGSSDGSRAVIAGYGDRVRAIYQDNAGQRAACNAGFACTSGEVVIFLDADDLLDRSVAREIAAVWRPGISKVQFRMQVIDARGASTGSVFPDFAGASAGMGSGAPTPQQIRSWAQRSGAYPTPPGSGNAYARDFLERIFPLQGSENACDSYCLAAAPLLGDVVTIARPLVCYRVHGRNDGAMATVEATRFAREVGRAQFRFRYAQQIAASVGLSLPDTAFRHSLATLPYRLASLRLAPAQHPVAGDSLAAVVADTLRACFVPQGRALPARGALLLWTVLVALLPDGAAQRLVLWRFASVSRPPVIRRALELLRVARR